MTDLLAGFMPIGQFAKNVRKNIRTVYRWTDEPDGLPYTRLGNQRLIHIESARAWLMTRMRHLNRGRRNHRPARR
jgi:hypothetical protein